MGRSCRGRGKCFTGISPLPAPSSHSPSLWLVRLGLGGAVSLLISQTRCSCRSEPRPGCSHGCGAGPPPFPSHIPGAFGVCGAAGGTCVPWISEHSPALGPSCGSKWAFLVLVPPVAAEASWMWWLPDRAGSAEGAGERHGSLAGIFVLFFFVLLSFFKKKNPFLLSYK